MYAAERSHTYVTDSVVHVRVSWTMETPQETSMHRRFQNFWVLKLGTIRKEKGGLPFTFSSHHSDAVLTCCTLRATQISLASVVKKKKKMLSIGVLGCDRGRGREGRGRRGRNKN